MEIIFQKLIIPSYYGKDFSKSLMGVERGIWWGCRKQQPLGDYLMKPNSCIRRWLDRSITSYCSIMGCGAKRDLDNFL